ncbi:hypothetical protein OHN37_33055 [Streptomyces sp. NBC_00485]|uniref:hypothetical protein n=1 Tax=unclassified Streptomyces TaxID=2593676 RepID=UPI002E185AB9
MSEKNERPKPPARRTSGRALGGAKKTTQAPPPPAAELTPEQFAADQAARQSENGRTAGEQEVQTVPSNFPTEGSVDGRAQAAPEVAQPAAQLTVEVAPSEPRQELPGVLAPERAVPAIQAMQSAEPLAQHDPSHSTVVAAGAVPTTEVAVRPEVPSMAGGTAFPVKTDVPGPHREQAVRVQESPSEGTPYAHGPGRPKDVPEAAVVLNQRIIARESLDSSVPAALRLKKRIKRFALDNELDHLPIGDIVAVALDEWLTTRGF